MPFESSTPKLLPIIVRVLIAKLVNFVRYIPLAYTLFSPILFDPNNAELWMLMGLGASMVELYSPETIH